jgi:serine phosphatase RsbU (regulator of sigma subunit)
MQHFEPSALATVLYAVFDPAMDQMRICLAGHFPPVIAAPGRPAELVRAATGLLIGADAKVRRPVTTVTIPPGALLCFYTDGLVERPGEVINDGLARLCGVVSAQSPEAACATVMSALIGNEPARDDVALLMIRRRHGTDT